MEFAIGQTVGGYEFLEHLETSGFGIAYKVRNLSEDRPETLKVLPKGLDSRPEGLGRFQREARIQARLIHPNVVRFYRTFELEDRHVITTEWPDGISLALRLRQGPVPLAESVDIISQALAGLGYAHGQGIVHRCVAPGNLIVDRGGIVKITGFGLAEAIEDPQVTLRGFVIGEPEYIAPEQVEYRGALDGRADLYAAAAVLYHLTTGSPPFQHSNIFQVMQAHVSKPAIPPESQNPEVPPELSRVILRGLAKTPRERFRTAEEFAEALGGVLQELSFRAALRT